VAHRPSVPRWLAGGSRAVSTPACEAGHSLVRPPPRAARPTSKRASLEPGPAVRVPAPVPGSRRQAAPHHRPPAAFTTSRARVPDERPPPRRRVRLRPIPTQTRHRGLRAPAHKDTTGLGAYHWLREQTLQYSDGPCTQCASPCAWVPTAKGTDGSCVRLGKVDGSWARERVADAEVMGSAE
jgi:hypothetical protein